MKAFSVEEFAIMKLYLNVKTIEVLFFTVLLFVPIQAQSPEKESENILASSNQTSSLTIDELKILYDKWKVK